jgi:hypothetical protein
MLIRVCAHFSRRNMNGIDELIRIEGLPDDVIFRFKDGKRYLKSPWEPDLDANIPVHIRSLCTPMDITEDLPVEKNEQTGKWQAPSDTRRILGVRVQLDNNPGREMWAQIERILDRGTPRDQKIPVPAVVAPNQKDPFSLEVQDIPVVNLRPEPGVVVPTVTVASNVEAQLMPRPEEFICGVCSKSFSAQRGLWMHERKTRHKVKEPVGA